MDAANRHSDVGPMKAQLSQGMMLEFVQMFDKSIGVAVRFSEK